ncbi:GDSL family lipase [Candidatus Poribacteria bacterium]|nr:GDSL family lipase [Candidatus Poribacteria bacterium]
MRADDDRLSWMGAVSLEVGDGWVQPWRIPHEERALYPPDALRERAAMAAGVRLAFRTTSASITGRLAIPGDASAVDIAVDGELRGSAPLPGAPSFTFDGLPPEDKLVELWLPQSGRVRLSALELDGDATLTASAVARPRWTTYGSSISQCGAAESPAYTWPAIVARERELDLTCLGFGGQCHLDPMIARLIRDLPADVITICAGINIQGGSSLNPRSFGPALIGTVRTIREKHPTIPIGLISPIFSPPRETTPNAVGFSLQGMREEVEAAVEALRSCGDSNVHYFSGLDVFGPDLAHLLPDDLHPDADGYKALGRNFADVVMRRLFPA